MTTTITGSGVSLGGPGVNPSDGVTKSQLDLASVPVGTIIAFTSTTPPAGYIKCNGASLSRTTYNTLFTVIGTTFGAPDSLTFQVPDLRGEFIRGFDDGRGVDVGRGMGTWQGAYAGYFQWSAQSDDGDGQTGSYTSITRLSIAGSTFNAVDYGQNGASGAITAPITPDDAHPRNVALPFYIKYQ
ncbi:MAG TPA: phage tail protein [Methanosarcina sp.]|nr:phage tail protein [Methanosarcina sp.]